MQTIDFDRSYLRFRIDLAAQPSITLTHKAPTTVNNVRINLECRCELFDRRSGKKHVYALSSSCKSERVGAQRDCWLLPNSDFCVIASDEEFLLMKSWARIGLATQKDSETDNAPVERQSGLVRDAWPEFSLQMRPARGRLLTSIGEIIGSIRGDRPIVARTEYDDGDFHVAIEYPVKTINYSEEDAVFQTDTGPVLLPDLTENRLSKCQRLIDCFDLAFAAFNSKGWTEFIVNTATPVGEGISVNHYSQPHRIEPVENSLVEVLPELSPLRVETDRAIRVDGAEALALAGSGLAGSGFAGNGFAGNGLAGNGLAGNRAVGSRRDSEDVILAAEKGEHR
jgi:hypothetical protein